MDKKIEFLKRFSACDVSDALLKLDKREGTHHGGYLADIVPFAPKSPLQGSIDEQPKIVAPASTIKYVAKSADAAPKDSECAVPPRQHYVDMTESGTVVVMEQPEGQTCAVLGGIMATRMKMRGAKAMVTGGRVRDLAELRENGLPIWAKAKSTVGTGAESKIWGRECRVVIRGVDVEPGDIIFCDPLEGVVRIPKGLLDEVIELMPKLVDADDKVKVDVLKGGSVFDAFQKHRGAK